MSFGLVTAAVAGAVLYGPVTAGLVSDWLTDAGAAHGAFVAAGAGIVLVRRWPAVRALPLHPARGAFGLMAVAMLVYLAGTLVGDVFVQRVSLPIALAAAAAAVAGWAQLRLLMGPIALIALSIPLPAVLVTHLTLPLQLMATQIAERALDLSNIEVVRQGNLLVLDRVTLEVADVCSGLRSIASLLAVAAVIVTVQPFPAWRRAVVLGAVLPVAIVGNGVRIAATGALATWMGPDAARGLAHELTGFAGFAAMCAAVFAVVIATRFISDGRRALPRAA